MKTVWQKFLEVALGQKPGVNKNKAFKHPDVVRKHLARLKDTGFEACAICPGCSGRAQNGLMRCSNAGATGAFVTIEQASSCRGDKPQTLLVSRAEIDYRAAA